MILAETCEIFSVTVFHRKSRVVTNAAVGYERFLCYGKDRRSSGSESS